MPFSEVLVESWFENVWALQVVPSPLAQII